jgi:AcrR family transcriptional regulator
MELEDDTRVRILNAAQALVATGGPDAATTRAVAADAGVQAPAIYRLFGDKQGLLDAVAEHAISKWVAKKASRAPHKDPIEDLRIGWDQHVKFGLENPGLFSLMNMTGRSSPATQAGIEVLRARIRRIAAAGRLRVPEERALTLIHSVGVGIVQTLLAQPEASRDPEFSELARESVIATITTETRSRSSGVASAAVTLRATLDETDVLTNGERALLDELLTRISKSR